jgi:hypothetical protein
LIIHVELSRSNPIVSAVKKLILEHADEMIQGTNFVATPN